MEQDYGPEAGREQALNSESINISSLENDELIIEENTIYEIDLNCYECMKKEGRDRRK